MPDSQSQTPEQDRLDEEEIFQALRAATENDLRRLAKILADTPDNRLFGKTEFIVRDHALRVGADALAAALAARKKGATKVQACLVPTVPARRGSSATDDGWF